MSDKKYWNEIYYSNLEDSEKDFLKETWLTKYKEIIGKVKNKNAIDLGCGLGQDSVWLKENGFNVISCDFSKKALDKFKEMHPEAKIMNFDFTEGLDFESNSIGIVNANLSLHYFDKKTTIKVFNDIYDILEKDGLFVGRMNSDKNQYVNDNYEKIEDNFYYDRIQKQHKRLFNRELFDELTEKWQVIVLKENETVRRGRVKYTWEFILKK